MVTLLPKMLEILQSIESHIYFLNQIRKSKLFNIELIVKDLIFDFFVHDINSLKDIMQILQNRTFLVGVSLFKY